MDLRDRSAEVVAVGVQQRIGDGVQQLLGTSEQLRCGGLLPLRLSRARHREQACRHAAPIADFDIERETVAEVAERARVLVL